jgi:hypothetical protein
VKATSLRPLEHCRALRFGMNPLYLKLAFRQKF